MVLFLGNGIIQAVDQLFHLFWSKINVLWCFHLATCVQKIRSSVFKLKILLLDDQVLIF